MKKITIYTAGTLGDHLPFIALAQALNKRGYRVRMALNESMAGYAEQAGVEAIPLTNLEGGETEARSFARAWDFWKQGKQQHPESETTSNRDQEFIEQCRELTLCCRDSDLLLATSIRPQGYIAARLSGVPWVTVSMNPSIFIFPASDDDLARLKRVRREEYERLAPALVRIFQTLGMDYPTPPMTNTWFWAPLVILASSPYFARPDLNQLQPQADLVQTGFLYYEDPSWQNWQPDEELRAFCEPVDPSDRPMVLAFSSQPLEDPAKILANHALAAHLLGKKLLVQRGWAGFSAEMLPEGVDRSRILFRDFLPQDWLFARAACTIQHGGMGSIARAIRQACPLLVEPFGNDQFFNASRVRTMGVGAAVHPFQISPETIARVLREQVLSAPLKLKINKLAEKFQAENGAENACDVIDQYLSQNEMSTRHWTYPPIYRDDPFWQKVARER